MSIYTQKGGLIKMSMKLGALLKGQVFDKSDWWEKVAEEVL